MTPVRRLAAVVLASVLGFGVVAITATPASAADTTWGTSIRR